MAIVLLGPTGVGKSTIGKLLSLNIGYKIIEIGYYVKSSYYKKIFKKNISNNNDPYVALQLTNEHFFSKGKECFVNQRLNYVSSINNKFGNNYFLKELLKKEDNSNLIIIGVRNKEEIEIIKQKFHKTLFVLLKCEKQILEKRFVKREQERMSELIARQIFEKRYGLEILNGSFNLEEIIDLAINTDYMMPNDIVNLILTNYFKIVNFSEGSIKDKNDRRIIC